MCVKLPNTLAASKECSINVAILLKRGALLDVHPGGPSNLPDPVGWAGLGWAGLTHRSPGAGRVPELSLQPSAGLLHTDGGWGQPFGGVS